ncbi:MAG: DUF11 domain-containing protein [Anaerolineales bacterium]|nr:DUF11 domain-containing protein [Anaerolineales bacterium]
MADNGGPIETLALPKGSQAIDAAGYCTTIADEYLTEDARGYLRPQGGACDIGAYEALLADLAIEKTGPISVTAGDEFVYEITIYNNGSATAENIVVTDTLPYGISYVSDVVGCTESAGVLRCEVPFDLPAGTSLTGWITVTTAVDFCYTGKVNNYVEIDSDTPETYVVNNRDEWGTVVINNATLEISKVAAPSPVTAGGIVNFGITITNTGPGCASDVTLVDEIGYSGNPEGLTMVDYTAYSTQGDGPFDYYWYGCSSGGACTRAEPMPAGVTDVISLSMRVPSGTSPGMYNNYADLVWDSGNSYDSVLYLVDAEADLEIQKSVIKDEICLGAYGFYELVVENDGPSDAQSITVTDVLPTGLIYGGGSSECSYDEISGAVTCTLDELAAGDTYDFLVGFNIDDTIVVSGTFITNTATVASATTDPVSVNNEDDATFMAVQCFLPETDMAIVKEMDDPVNAGETVHITLTVTNNGPHWAEEVTVQDVLYDGLEVAEAEGWITPIPYNWGCDAGLTCVRNNPMPPGFTSVINFTVTVPADWDAGWYRNMAFVTADNPESNLVAVPNNWYEYWFQVTNEADLSLQKSVLDDQVCLDDDASGLYEIVVANNGPSDARNVQVSDMLPAGLDFEGASPECVYDGGTGEVTCTLSRLAAGDSYDFLVGFGLDRSVVFSGTTVLNTATVTSDTPEGNPGDESDDAEFTATQCFLPETDLQISKTMADPVNAGEEVMVTLTVTNDGPHWAENVTVQDVLYGGMELVGAGMILPNPLEWSCDGGLTCIRNNPMAPDTTETIYFTVSIPADWEAGSYRNVAFVTADNPDGLDAIPPNHWSEYWFEVTTDAELSIEKNALVGQAIAGGDEVLYSIVVTNDGPSVAYSVEITDTAEAGLTVLGLVPGDLPMTCLGGTCTIASLGVGESVEIYARVEAPADTAAGSYDNTACVADTADTTDNTPVCSSASIQVIAIADLELVKTATPTAIAGDLITYTITVANLGPSDAQTVQVLDTLPDDISSPTVIGCPSGGLPICTLGTLVAGDSATYTIVVTADSDLEPGTSLENTAEVLSSTPDDNDINNSDNADTSIIGLASLVLTKTGSGTAVAGDTITYTLTVLNDGGPSVAQSVEVIDTLPAEVTLVSAVADQGSCTLAGACDLGDIAVDATVTIELVGVVAADTASGAVLQNTAMLQSDTPFGPASVTSATWDTTIETEASLIVEKDDLGDFIVAGGDPLQYIITVYNDGPSDAIDVVVEDTPLLTGLSLNGSLEPGNQMMSCSGNTCTIALLAAGESVEIYANIIADPSTPEGANQDANQACITGATVDNLLTPSGACNVETTDVVVSADVAIDKRGPTEVFTGVTGSFDYEITVWNNGPSDAENVVVTDTLPYGILYVSDTDSCTEIEEGVLRCELGDIAGGESVMFTITVEIDPEICFEGKVNNYVEVVSDIFDADLSNNDDDWGTIIVNNATISINKTASPGSVVAGDLVDFVVTVTNEGPGCAIDVTVVDELGYGENPEGLNLVTYDDSSTQVGQPPFAGYWYACSGGAACTRSGPLLPWDSDTITLTVRVPAETAPNTYVNFADVNWDSGASTASTSYEVIAEADLSIEKSVIKDDICLGAYGFFEIEVTNHGTSDAQNVIVTDELDDVLIFGGGSPGCTHDGSATGGVVTCELGTIPAGATVDLLIGFNIEELTPAPYPVDNTAEVTSDTYDPDTGNNSDDASFTAVQCFLPPVDMELDKDISPSTVESGDELQFSLLVTNHGPNTAEDVILQDRLMPGLEFISADISDLVDSLGAVRTCSLGVNGLLCTLGAMESDEWVLVDVTVQIERGRDYCGRHANTATVRADNPEIDTNGTYGGYSNTDSELYTIVCSSDLDIEKTSLSADRTVGQEEHALFEIEVTNHGPTDWELPVIISDTFTAIHPVEGPQDVTFSGGSPSCSIVGDALVCRVPDGLAYGETADFLVDIYVGDTVVSGTLILNRVDIVQGDDATEPEYDDFDEVSVEVVQKFGPPVDMTVEKTVTDPWIAGESGMVVIRVTNNSPHYATGVTVLDPIYMGAEYEGFAQFEDDGVTPIYEWGCSAGATCVRENPMPPYAEEVLVLYATLPADIWEEIGATGVNHVFVTSQHNDPDPSNNYDEVPFAIETEVTLSIEKAALIDQIVAGGDAVLYNIVVYNDGPSDAYDVVIEDTVETGLVLVELVPGDLEIDCTGAECTIPLLKAGESVEIYARVLAPSETLGGEYDNTVCVTDVGDTYYNLPCSTATVPVVEAADLAIDKDGPTVVYAGDTFDYVVTVYNNGPADALNVVVTDTLPYGISFVDDSLSACTETDGVLRCELGDILAGESVQFTITVLAEPDVCYEGKVNNYVEVSSDTFDNDMANNDDDWGTIIINNTTLTISKTATTVIAGELVEFVITVANEGPGCATDVTVVDELSNSSNPEGLVLVDSEDTSTQAGTPPFDGEWYACSGGASCTRGEPLLAGETDVITLLVRVPADTVPATYTNYADVDWDSGNASAFAEYEVTTEADLSIAKTVIKEDICLGAYGIYEIVVTNNGSSDAQDVVVTDVIPDILYFGGASPACTVAGVNPATGMGGTVTCQLGTVPAGASIDLMIGFNIWEYLESGTVVDNTATVATTTSDPVSANNSDSVSFTAVQCYLPPVDLGLEKTVGPQYGSDPWPPFSGQQFKFEFSVTNYGPNTAEDVVLHDHVGAYNDGLVFLYAEMDDPYDDLGQLRDCTLGVDGLICTLGAVSPDEDVTFTVWVKARTERQWCGQWTNFATVRADNPEFGSGGASTPVGWNPQPNNDSAEYEIQCVSDLSIDKSALTVDRTVGQEEHVLFEIEVTNYGPSESDGYVIVEDTFTAIHPVEGPQDVTFSGGSPSCQIMPGGTEMWCAVESLAVGETVDFLVDLYVGDTVVSGTMIVNTAEIIGGDDISFPYEIHEDVDQESVEVIQKFGPPVDMSVEKTVTDPWIAGTTGMVTIRVTNEGPHYATGVQVLDPLYLGALYEGFAQFKADGVTPIAEWVCDAGVGCIRENPMRPYATEVLVLYATLPADVWDLYGQVGVNDVYVTSQHNDPDITNNWDRVYFDIETEVTLSIDKTALVDEIVAGGETVLYRIVVYNDGPSDAYDVEVTDTVDAGLTLVELIPGDLLMDCSGDTCTIPLLQVGESAEIYVRVLAPTDTLAGEYDNEACVTDTGDTYYNTPCSTATLDVTNWADLKIIKTATPTVNGGEYISYTLQVYNFGPSLARNIVVTDTLPADVKWSSYSSGCTPSGQDAGGFGGVIVCTESELAVGDMVQYEIIVWVDPSVEPGTSLENWAEVVSDTPDPDETDNLTNADTSIVGKADLVITKMDEPDPVVAGEELVYTIVITNNGPSYAESVVVVDNLPSELILQEITVAGADAAECDESTCQLGDMAVEQVVTIEIVAMVATDVPTGTVLANTVRAFTDSVDPDADNSTWTEETTVWAVSELTVDKTGDDVVVAGETIAYTIVVGNNGPSDATSVIVTDQFPSQLTNIMAVAHGMPGACSVVGNLMTCNLGDLPVGETVTIDVTADVLSSALPGTITNQVDVASPEDEDGVSDTHDTDIERLADMWIDKSATPTVYGGELITYVLSVENFGPSDARDVVVTDVLPEGVYDVDPGSCSLAGMVVTCDAGTIVAGAGTSFTIVVRAEPGLEAGTSLENQASVISTEPDPDMTNNSADADTSVVGKADLAVTKTGPDTAIAGEEIIYEIVVTNGGPSFAESVVVVDELPTSLKLLDISADKPTAECDDSACQLGDMAVNETVTIEVVALVSSDVLTGTEITNKASAFTDSVDPDWVNNSDYVDTTIQAFADLAVDKSDLNDPVHPTGSVIYEIEVTNNGPSDAQNLVVTDTLGEYLTYTGASPSCTHQGGSDQIVCRLDTLASGATVDFLIQAVAGDVPSGTVVYNGVVVSSDTVDLNGQNDTDSEDTLVQQNFDESADLSLVKTADRATVVAGEFITYTLVVENNGPSAAQSVQLWENYPSDTEIVDISIDNPSFENEFCNQLTGFCYLGFVYPEEGYEPVATPVTVTVVLYVHPDYEDDTLTNQAVVFSNMIDKVSTNDLDSVTVDVDHQADLEITKVADPNPVIPGERLTFMIEVTNYGPSDAENVVVTDMLAPELLNGRWLPDQGSCDAGICELGTIPAGESVSIIIVVDVDPATVEPIYNEATVDSSTEDPDRENNSDDVTVEVTPTADLALTKEDSAATVNAGDLITYTLTVYNDGPSDAMNVVVVDTLPEQVTLISMDEPACVYDGDLTITCSQAILEVGDSVIYTIVVQTDPDIYIGTSLQNEATVSSDAFDPELADNWDSVDTSIIFTADISITKDGPDRVMAGDIFTFTITVINEGPSDVGWVRLKDLYPEVLTLLDVSITYSGEYEPCECVDTGPGGSSPLCLELKNMEAGEVATIELVVTTDFYLMDEICVENYVEVYDSGPQPDDDLTNNIDTHGVCIYPRYHTFLPMISGGSGLPDLIGSFVIEPAKGAYTTNDLVVIKAYVTNIGSAPATTYWVDFYIDPDPVPTEANMPWEVVTGEPHYGISWQVWAPIYPGETIELISKPFNAWYQPFGYDVAHTVWWDSFAKDSHELYLYVDSWNPYTVEPPIGVVRESNEDNNLYGPIPITITSR